MTLLLHARIKTVLDLRFRRAVELPEPKRLFDTRIQIWSLLVESGDDTLYIARDRDSFDHDRKPRDEAFWGRVLGVS